MIPHSTRTVVNMYFFLPSRFHLQGICELDLIFLYEEDSFPTTKEIHKFFNVIYIYIQPMKNSKLFIIQEYFACSQTNNCSDIEYIRIFL